MDRGSLLLAIAVIASAAVGQSVSPAPSSVLPAHAGVAVAETPFGDEAYPVKWPSAAYTPVAAETPFGEEAYTVKWPTAKAPEAAEPAHGGLHVKRGMLFLRKSLYPGAVLPQGTRLAGKSMPMMRFVSRRDAEAFPFSFTELERILTIFKILPGSTRAEQVAATLHTCEGSSTDAHTCATSQQAEVDFAAEVLGSGNLRRIISLVHGANEPAQYTVVPKGISRIGGSALVACHPMAYPYVVRYCHRPANVDALQVQLSGIGGGATAVAVCHKNTTTWDSRYFDMLNATRGEQICHYMPQNYVLWLKME